MIKQLRLLPKLSILLILCGGVGLQATPPETRCLKVKGTETGEFEAQMSLLKETVRHRVFKITYPSPITTDIAANNLIPAEYFQPKGINPDEPQRPAVVCLHILGGNFEVVRLLCSIYAENGIPAIWFKMPYYGERGPNRIKYQLQRDARRFAGAIEQAIDDIQRTVDLLETMPEIDARKIGVAGVSLGAIIGATACERIPRLKRAGLVIGGGDLDGIIHHAHETRGLSQYIKSLPPKQKAEVDRLLQKVDPLNNCTRLRSLAAQNRVTMFNAPLDDTIPPKCTRKLAQAIGMEKRVVWFTGLGHYTILAALPQITTQLVENFSLDMPAGVSPPPTPASTTLPPENRLAEILLGLTRFVGASPAEGKCHLLNLNANVTEKSKKSYQGSLTLVRGSNRRFKLDCVAPIVKKLAVGSGEHPWLGTKNGEVFIGTENALPGRSILNYVNMQQMVKIQVAIGAVSALCLSPNSFNNYLTVTVEKENGHEVLALALHHRHARGSARIHLAEDGKTPTLLTFEHEDISGRIVFNQWLLDTISSDELFEPTKSAKQTPVRQEDLFRMFAATFEYAMESAQ